MKILADRATLFEVELTDKVTLLALSPLLVLAASSTSLNRIVCIEATCALD